MVVVLCDMVSSRSSPINITTLRPTVLAIFMEAVVYNEKQERVTMTKEDEGSPRLAAPQKILDAGAMHRSTQSAILTGE